MVAHRAWVTHVDRSAVVHVARHALHVLLGLVQTGEGRHLNLGLEGGAASQTESGHGGVASVPEVVACAHDLHVDALSLGGILREMNLVVEPKHVVKNREKPVSKLDSAMHS